MKTGKNRQIAALHMRALGRINNFIGKMRGISLMMSNHPELYPSPNPPLATFNQQIDELIEAEAETSRKRRGSAQERNKKYNQVVIDVHALLNYVQTLADNAADEEEAILIIVSSGFDLKKSYVRTKPDFEARNTMISGTVKLIAKSAGKDSFNEWQISDDGEVWEFLPTTTKASTLVKGLEPKTEKFFRHRPVLRKTKSNWSQIVSLIVR